MLKRFIKLAKEPSTFAGLAGLLGGAGIFSMTEDQWVQIFGALAGVAGAMAMIFLDTADVDDD